MRTLYGQRQPVTSWHASHCLMPRVEKLTKKFKNLCYRVLRPDVRGGSNAAINSDRSLCPGTIRSTKDLFRSTNFENRETSDSPSSAEGNGKIHR